MNLNATKVYLSTLLVSSVCIQHRNSFNDHHEFQFQEEMKRKGTCKGCRKGELSEA